MTDIPRPAHLTAENAATFQLPGVVEAYHLRTPYGSGLEDCLRRIMRPDGGTILELGCGTGEIARRLAPFSERVDAIDISAAMLERAMTLPGGRDPRIRWILGAAEDVPLDSPYALAIAGDALHWMTWEVVLPRVRAALGDGAVLAIVTAAAVPPAWASALQEIIPRYSAMQNFEPYDLVDVLAKRGLFESLGAESLDAEPFGRSVAEYVESFHAMAGLARERIGAEASRLFDDEVRALVTPFAHDGSLELSTSTRVMWGSPLP